MIEEQLALLDSLERNPDMPLPQKRGILNVLYRAIQFMSVEDFQRFQKLEQEMEPLRKQMNRVVSG